MKNNPNMSMLMTVVAILFLASYGIKENSVLTSGPGGVNDPYESVIGEGYDKSLQRTTPASNRAAKKTLAEISVGQPRSMKGYSRSSFSHWSSTGGGCSARETTLKLYGDNVRTNKSCKILSGKWSDPYTAKTFTDPGKLDIDHIVPLANAYRSGADKWTDAQRKAFANDYKLVLIPVDSSANRAKGDKDPSAWKPPNRAYWPAYAQHWIKVKKHYKLSMTANEKKALESMLGS